jgi:RNA polymerase sigma-70 factor (ECF subfamily)
MKANEMSDNELVDQFINGAPEALEILINRYKNKIFSYICFNVKNQALAEDIFQDTIIKAMKSLQTGKYTDNGRFLSWVLRIAHNLIVDHFRRDKQLPTCSNDNYEQDLFNSPKYSDSNVEQEMVNNQVYSDLRKLLDFLPDDQKEIILLRHYGDFSFKEIAEMTNVSINTALGRMRYALINLRKLIKEHDVSLTLG